MEHARKQSAPPLSNPPSPGSLRHFVPGPGGMGVCVCASSLPEECRRPGQWRSFAENLGAHCIFCAPGDAATSLITLLLIFSIHFSLPLRASGWRPATDKPNDGPTGRCQAVVGPVAMSPRARVPVRQEIDRHERLGFGRLSTGNVAISRGDITDLITVLGLPEPQGTEAISSTSRQSEVG